MNKNARQLAGRVHSKANFPFDRGNPDLIEFVVRGVNDETPGVDFKAHYFDKKRTERSEIFSGTFSKKSNCFIYQRRMRQMESAAMGAYTFFASQGIETTIKHSQLYIGNIAMESK